MKLTYEYAGFGGVTNCDECDDFTHIDEYNRNDGLVCFFCEKCIENKGLNHG